MNNLSIHKFINTLQKEYDLDERIKSSITSYLNVMSKYFDLFKNFFTPIIYFNKNHQIVDFNNAVIEYFGNPNKNNIRTKRKEAFFHFLKKRLEVFSMEKPITTTFEKFHKTFRGERFFSIRIEKIFKQNHYDGSLVILDDLSERKEFEKHLEIAKLKAEDADRLKTAFLSNISHEIRTPMNAIIGFSELILNKTITEKDRIEYLKLIRESSSTLLNIIDDIVDLANIETQQLTIKKINFILFNLMKEIYENFKSIMKDIRKNNIKLDLKVKEEYKNEVIKTDYERLKQILKILLEHALRYTVNGEIEFGYHVFDTNHIYFYVKDTGTGIPREKQLFLFEDFTNSEDEYPQKHKSSGLGLNLAQKLIHLLGGSIWIDSEPGKGSTINFVLPQKDIEDDAIQESVYHKSKALDLNNDENFLHNVNILIAEDDDTNYYYLNEILKIVGGNVLWAKNGLEAVNIVESNQNIDIVFMDIKMPVMDGLEAIKYIKLIRPKLPIIAQTAFVMPEDKVSCLDAGCCDYLLKPIDRQLLYSVIHKHLVKKSRLHVAHKTT